MRVTSACSEFGAIMKIPVNRDPKFCDVTENPTVNKFEIVFWKFVFQE